MIDDSMMFLQAHRPSLRESPFGLEASGFDPVWWRIPSNTYRNTYHHWYHLVQGQNELVRVEVNTARSIRAGDYRGWDWHEQVVEITFIEVRVDQHRLGLGSAVIRELALRYPERTLIAHPRRSDSFWQSIGFQRYESMGPHKHTPPLYAMSPQNGLAT